MAPIRPLRPCKGLGTYKAFKVSQEAVKSFRGPLEPPKRLWGALRSLVGIVMPAASWHAAYHHRSCREANKAYHGLQ